MNEIGVVIVGVNGAVASTLIAGVELMKRGFAPRIGMVTERTEANVGEQLADLLDLAPLDSLVFAGWDVRFPNVLEGALHHKVLPRDTLSLVADELRAITPWPSIFSREYAQNVQGEHVLPPGSHRAQIAAIVSNIQELKRERGLSRVVMVNLGSTEAFRAEAAVHETLGAFEDGLDRDDPAITPAMRYFYAANQAGAAYCNFAPSLTNVPALAAHALVSRTAYAGMDGKTGQTLVKTALAAMFRVRRLHIEGWYSTNVLGNNDGLVLDSPDSNKTKLLSKAAVLDSIVGYRVENHHVHIHYYKPRGDSKEAWDNIDIVGFAGIPMQMKINFLCQDSALAAPLVLDLVRLLDVAQRHGSRGVQRQLAMFFKSPWHGPGEHAVHDLFQQEAMLLTWAREISRRPRAAVPGSSRPHADAGPRPVHANGVHAAEGE